MSEIMSEMLSAIAKYYEGFGNQYLQEIENIIIKYPKQNFLPLIFEYASNHKIISLVESFVKNNRSILFVNYFDIENLFSNVNQNNILKIIKIIDDSNFSITIIKYLCKDDIILVKNIQIFKNIFKQMSTIYIDSDFNICAKFIEMYDDDDILIIFTKIFLDSLTKQNNKQSFEESNISAFNIFMRSELKRQRKLNLNKDNNDIMIKATYEWNKHLNKCNNVMHNITTNKSSKTYIFNLFVCLFNSKSLFSTDILKILLQYHQQHNIIISNSDNIIGCLNIKHDDLMIKKSKIFINYLNEHNQKIPDNYMLNKIICY